MAALLPATGPFGAMPGTTTDYAPLETGRRIGKYRLVYPVGEGGMSVVYLAQDEVLDRRVAVKVLHRHLARDPEARSRFSREARAVARLTHRNIPEIYDFSDADASATSEGPSYLVTEYVDGAPLSRVLRDRTGNAGQTLLPELGVMLTLGVAHALAHAHSQSVVHRDVKPENVLIGKDGIAKLTDFGIAQIRGLESMTMTGTLIGSPAHMAPEQIEIAKDIDARADIWGFGTLLYMAVTGGKMPFEADNPHRLLKKIVDGHYTDPRRLSEHVDARLADIVSRCLIVDRDKRFQSISLVAKELEAWLVERGLSAYEIEIKSYMADPEGTSIVLAGRIAERLMTLGEAASQRGERSQALEHFGRVLVLDPGRDDAMLRVRKLEKQLRARKGVKRMVAAVGAGGVLAATVWLVAATGSTPGPVTVSVPARALTRSTAPLAPKLTPAPLPTAVNAGLVFGDAIGPELARFEVRVAESADAKAREEAKREEAKRDKRDDAAKVDPNKNPEPVPVRLTVFPPAVRIQLDGRPFAAGTETPLMPGSYRVVLTHAGCPECSPDVRTLVVPNAAPGQAARVDQHYDFEKRTEIEALEPATLFVKCDDGAYVTDPSGRRYDCNVMHALPVRSRDPETLVLTAHTADGARLRQQKFTLSPKRPIVWTL